MKIIKCIINIVFFLVFTRGFAQTTGNIGASVTLPTISLLDIEPVGAITMNFTAPTEAGQPLNIPANNSSKWINYTSAIALGGLTRRITASINQTIPGVDIRLLVANASGNGGGVLGSPASQITLSQTTTTIITGIGGAYTGNGANNGHMITIAFSINNYAALSAINNIPIVITYTITE